MIVKKGQQVRYGADKQATVLGIDLVSPPTFDQATAVEVQQTKDDSGLTYVLHLSNGRWIYAHEVEPVE